MSKDILNYFFTSYLPYLSQAGSGRQWRSPDRTDHRLGDQEVHAQGIPDRAGRGSSKAEKGLGGYEAGRFQSEGRKRRLQGEFADVGQAGTDRAPHQAFRQTRVTRHAPLVERQKQAVAAQAAVDPGIHEGPSALHRGQDFTPDIARQLPEPGLARDVVERPGHDGVKSAVTVHGRAQPFADVHRAAQSHDGPVSLRRHLRQKREAERRAQHAVHGRPLGPGALPDDGRNPGGEPERQNAALARLEGLFALHPDPAVPAAERVDAPGVMPPLAQDLHHPRKSPLRQPHGQALFERQRRVQDMQLARYTPVHSIAGLQDVPDQVSGGEPVADHVMEGEQQGHAAVPGDNGASREHIPPVVEGGPDLLFCRLDPVAGSRSDRERDGRAAVPVPAREVETSPVERHPGAQQRVPLLEEAERLPESFHLQRARDLGDEADVDRRGPARQPQGSFDFSNLPEYLLSAVGHGTLLFREAFLDNERAVKKSLVLPQQFC